MKKLSSVILFVAILVAACGRQANVDNPDAVAKAQTGSQPKPTYQWLSANVITPTCLPCHGEANPIQDHHGKQIRLGTYAHLMQFIVAGNPAKSKLFKDIKTGDMPRPKHSAQLSAVLIQAFQDWINAGAKETP